ncbi:IPExxxVDY family protein [Flavicella sediminum]|uniref:IPExxxVDY family protein n=1 Tax=Flavicella sediminum TaxID=2585141 RepID=UPI00111D5E98|nr:IPExxxVDY family protein [Flavicella sediminum]
MQIHSLEIDDFIDTDYSLISIHTGLEDYKLAYLLNEKLNVFFAKSRTSLELKENGQCIPFSVYSFNDEAQSNTWYLIENKYHGVSNKPISNGLFQTINETVNTTSYLVPEKKKMDFLLKIEGDFASYKLLEVIDSIKSIKQVITSYSIDISTLKSKDFLIF